MYDRTGFDGIWLDMNEVTSFCADNAGECPDNAPKPTENCPRFSTFPDDDDWVPIFNPEAPMSLSLQNQTLSLDAMYACGQKFGFCSEYNLHSLYGIKQCQTTFNVLTRGNTNYISKDERPFILSRSTFPGSGKYTAHWTGDNWQEWDYLRYSIAGIMDMNMFGIPMVGSDVCGFFGKKGTPYTKEEADELCARWNQLAIFYPFAKNHYNRTKVEPHEPYVLGDKWKAISKKAIEQRFTYMRYMYTKLFEAHKNGGTVIRPLFFEFPNDLSCHDDYEQSFMVGDALKVTPQLAKGSLDIPSYFPQGSNWIDINNPDIEIVSEGQTYNLKNSDDYINIHIRAGKIVPIQPYENHQSKTTKDLIHKAGITLLTYPDRNGLADGTVYIDNDGKSLSDLENENYQYFQFKFSSQNGKSIQFYQIGGKAQSIRQSNNGIIDEVRILGQSTGLDKTDFACWFSKDLTPYQMKFKWTGGYLSLTPDEGALLNLDEVHAI